MSYNPLLTRRHLLQILGAAGASAALGACAGPGASTNSGPATAAKTSGPVKGGVSFAHWRAEDKAVFEKIISQFHHKYPGASVAQDISTSDDYQVSALQQVKGGDVGDVFTAFRGAQFQDMAKAGLFTDLAGLSAVDRYRTDMLGPGQYQGTQLGLPYQLVFNMPVFNAALFEQHGISEPPRDWDGFLSLCDTLKSGGVTPIAYPGADLGNTTHLLNSMVMNNAPTPDMFTKIESGQYACTDDWFLKTLEQYAQLRPYVQPNATGTDVEPAEQMFASKQAAMLPTGSFHIIALRALGVKFPVGLLSPITVPAGEANYVGVHNATFILGANSASDNQAAATEFIEYLSDPEVAGQYANATVQHVTVEGVEYTNPDLKAIANWLHEDTILTPIYQFTDLDISDAVSNACVEVIGGTAPQQAAEEAQQIVNERLQ